MLHAGVFASVYCLLLLAREHRHSVDILGQWKQREAEEAPDWL